MTPSIQWLATKYLKSATNFSINETDNGETTPDEIIVGNYRNESNEDVTITNFGIRHKGKLIRYTDLDELVIDQVPHEATSINFVLNNGEHKRIPFDGGNGRFRDVWIIERFLAKVKTSLSKDS